MQINVENVRSDLIKNDYHVTSIIKLTEGSNHHVFDVDTLNYGNVIVKFNLIRETEKEYCSEHRDTMFNGLLSLTREENLYNICLDAKLNAPKVYGIYDSMMGKYIVTEKMAGKSFFAYLKDNDFELNAYLKSIHYLGQDFARLHQVEFLSFGNLMAKDEIDPDNVLNFIDYYRPIALKHLNDLKNKGGVSDSEYYKYAILLEESFNRHYKHCNVSDIKSTFVMTDMHQENYFVDSNGKPSGYFDLESAQAAPAFFEYYAFDFFLFNLFDEDTHKLARKTFYQAYNDCNGKYPVKTKDDQDLIDLFSALRALELANSYWGHIDGIRDNWGQTMKDVFTVYIDKGYLDYVMVGNMFRQRDNTPVKPRKNKGEN